MEGTPGKGQQKGSTGAHTMSLQPGGVVESLQALELPGLALCLQSDCPGVASLHANTVPWHVAESKELFFAPTPQYQISKVRQGCNVSTRLGLCPLGSSPTGTTTPRDFGKSHVSQKSPGNTTRSSLTWPYVS